MIKTIFKTLTTPSSFKNDWYGWVTHQIAHTAVGVGIVGFLCYAAFKQSGEFPYKWQVFAAVAFVYAAKEIFLDKWQGWDTIEDFLFVVVYGTGGTLVSFAEKDPGIAKVVFDLDKSAPVMVLCCFHLSCGVVYRLWRTRNER